MLRNTAWISLYLFQSVVMSFEVIWKKQLSKIYHCFREMIILPEESMECKTKGATAYHLFSLFQAVSISGSKL